MSIDSSLERWNAMQELAENAIPILGTLYRKFTCIIAICGKPLQNVSHLQIIKEHHFASEYFGIEISIHSTHPILMGLYKLRNQLNSTRIDIGILTYAWLNSEIYTRYISSNNQVSIQDSVEEFLKDELSFLLQRNLNKPEPKDIVLYGFGRIGRLLARLLIEKTGGGDKMRLRAIVVRKTKTIDDLEKRITLLNRDSVHGPFDGVITICKEKKQLIINGNPVQIIYSDHPSEIDYTEYGIKNAIVVDNTGAWRDRKGLSLHLQAKGASEVLLTAPGSGIPNVVAGINYDMIDLEKEKIYSAASCTTNAIVPILKVINDQFKILFCHVETIHSYTNDQNLIDGMHSKPRRGRGAAMNMVLTNTGAAEAVALALPELKGKISGNAVRVPTPNVSIAILMMNVASKTTKEQVNEYLRKIALDSRQIGYDSTGELVSTDLVGDRHAGIVDATSTIVEDLSSENSIDMSSIILYVWYDNEFGYSCQVVRLLQHMSPSLKLDHYESKQSLKVTQS